VPRAGWVKPQTDQRLSDHISIGVLTRVFPPELVDSGGCRGGSRRAASAAVAGTGGRLLRARLGPVQLFLLRGGDADARGGAVVGVGLAAAVERSDQGGVVQGACPPGGGAAACAVCGGRGAAGGASDRGRVLSRAAPGQYRWDLSGRR